jgi:mycothiol synthase
MDTTASNSPVIERSDPAHDKLVFGLAAQAWPEAERPGYWQSIQTLVQNQRANSVVLLAARNDGELIAAQIGQVLSGKAAVVWPPQFVGSNPSGREQITSELFQQMSGYLTAGGAHMAQALLPCASVESAAEFSWGGFTHAADLLYLACEPSDAPDNALSLPFELEPFSAAAEGRLIEIIDRTYIGTLDCPRIDGLRSTADAVTGYKSVGQFRPEWWQIVRQQGQDLGCLLVNVHPDVAHAEIVYLALVPQARGRGWGLLLAQEALRLASRANCQRVVLAVDAANVPAIALYQLAGFVEFDRRAVWIKDLQR